MSSQKLTSSSPACASPTTPSQTPLSQSAPAPHTDPSLFPTRDAPKKPPRRSKNSLPPTQTPDQQRIDLWAPAPTPSRAQISRHLIGGEPRQGHREEKNTSREIESRSEGRTKMKRKEKKRWGFWWGSIKLAYSPQLYIASKKPKQMRSKKKRPSSSSSSRREKARAMLERERERDGDGTEEREREEEEEEEE